jgi:hypothetical protein
MLCRQPPKGELEHYRSNHPNRADNQELILGVPIDNNVEHEISADVDGHDENQAAQLMGALFSQFLGIEPGSRHPINDGQNDHYHPEDHSSYIDVHKVSMAMAALNNESKLLAFLLSLSLEPEINM